MSSDRTSTNREPSGRFDGGICRINRCGRALGIGTHMSITGYGRAADQTLPVCEDHWQALRDILPVEKPPPPNPGLPSRPRRSS
jgi:hypothetical protein